MTRLFLLCSLFALVTFGSLESFADFPPSKISNCRYRSFVYYDNYASIEIDPKEGLEVCVRILKTSIIRFNEAFFFSQVTRHDLGHLEFTDAQNKKIRCYYGVNADLSLSSEAVTVKCGN